MRRKTESSNPNQPHFILTMDFQCEVTNFITAQKQKHSVFKSNENYVLLPDVKYIIWEFFLLCKEIPF